MIDKRLVARHRLEHVAVREGEDGLARGLGAERAGVEINAHALHGARRRVDEFERREVIHLFLFGLANAKAERGVRVLPIPGIAEVDKVLPGPEGLVRHRERRE